MYHLWRGRKPMVIAGLIVLVAGAAWTGTRLRAQDVGPTTADQAARELVAFLTQPYELRNQQTMSMAELVSDKDYKLLQNDGVDHLLLELYKEFRLAHWKTQTDNNGDSATVQFTPTDEIKPVVCVKQGQRWRVDLVATFGKWNDLDETASLRRISEVTGAIIPGVPINQVTANTICQSRLRQIALGVEQYVQDYDELYPPANKWCDVIQPYTKSEQILHCPAAAGKDYGYAMNWKLSRRGLAEIEAPADTVEHYESNVLQRNRNGDGKDLTARHELDAILGGNYAYADGHVKWWRQDAPQEFRLFLTPPKSAPKRTGETLPPMSVLVTPPKTAPKRTR